MKNLATILIILSALTLRAQEKYSVNVMAEYSSVLPKAGISAIMEGNMMSFRGMVLVGESVYTQVKMGVNVGETGSSRILVFPFYLNMENYRYNTPVGLMWSKSIKNSTLELGADFWREKTEGKTKSYCTANISLSYKLFGNRYLCKK
jgi:hypothetical protein